MQRRGDEEILSCHGERQPSLFLVVLVGMGNNGCSAGRHSVSVNGCSAWRTNVESNNARDWDVVPPSCISYVGKYMRLGQYQFDFKVAVEQCLAYVNDLELVGDGKDAWVFDIDETSLSNLPYYAKNEFGGDVFNSTSFNEYVAEGTAPVLPATWHLYNVLLVKGVKIFFLTGRHEDQRVVTTKNLKRAGYKHWAALLLKNESEQGMTALKYKSGRRGEVVKKGYRIWGNVGDQWSDITGTSVGARTFKLPNPMYYLS